MKQAEIAQLLPGVFQRTLHAAGPLAGLLAVMEDLQAPSEAVLAHLDAFFDPYRAPDSFVPLLAGWVDLESLLRTVPQDENAPPPPFPPGTGRLRELVAAAVFLSQWRGTAKGLLRFLETATGVRGFTLDEQVPGPDGRPRPFHVRVAAPQVAAPYSALIERIIELEKPAYVTHELVFS